MVIETQKEIGVCFGLVAPPFPVIMANEDLVQNPCRTVIPIGALPKYADTRGNLTNLT